MADSRGHFRKPGRRWSAACVGAVLLVGTTCSVAAFAQPAEPAHTPLQLAQELDKHRLPITLVGSKLEGGGARFLEHAAARSEFFLVGEDHGFAETPRFVQALYETLHHDGYRYYASEIGPSGAKSVVQLARSKDADKAFAGYLQQNPFSLPFYSWVEEAELAQAVVNADAKRPDPIWGLDQEFIMSSKPIFARLLELASDAGARKTVGTYKARVDQEFDVMVKSGNPASVFLASATAEDFARLRTAMHPKAGDEAFALLDELEQSAHIYRMNFTGQGYQSNVARSLMMKRHFMAHYRQAEARDHTPPRVLFKLGAYHIKRGKSYIDVHDVGNLAQELALANGMQSFHLLVVALDGTQNTYRPFGGKAEDKAKAYNVTESYDFLNVAPLIEAAKAPDARFAADSWQVFDLEPLRADLAAGKFGPLGKGLEELIFGYDAILVMRNVHAAKFFE